MGYKKKVTRKKRSEGISLVLKRISQKEKWAGALMLLSTEGSCKNKVDDVHLIFSVTFGCDQFRVLFD